MLLLGMVICPRCGRDNPEGFRFCGFCGAALGHEAEAVPEERKVVTVLFCDLVGFTASSQHADPEDVRARVAPYFARLRASAEAFAGSVEKFIGDAIMAVFGIPHAHEDDPERAVRTALQMLREIDALNAADPSLELTVRIGIHTGEVLVRLTPAYLEREGMVTGGAVNLASRLQGVAPEGGIVVSETTFRATHDVFDYEELPPVTLKGITGAVRVWRPTAARAPLGVDITRTHTTPLVGRTEELELLERTFARAVRDATVQTVTVVGESGIGKSRLVVELNRYLDASHDPVRWLYGRCVPFGEGITFWALGEIVKAEARIYDSDDSETVASKLASVVPDDPDQAWIQQRLRALVGLPAAEASREENFAAWRRFLEQLAADRPSVFVFEDLHWADDAMVAFVEELAEYAEGVPMLLLATARPEFYQRRPSWLGGIRNAATVDLAPLSEGESGRLAGLVVGGPDLPAEVRRLIAERSDGNPLFAEEFIGLLVERGLLRREGSAWRFEAPDQVPLPTTVQALIAARLDTLAPEQKALLADAAVIGETFWVGALASMGGVERSDVDRSLHELSRRELVRRARTPSIQGEAEFTFWHALIRDVAYEQLPRVPRALRHVAAAAWLERAAPERLGELSEVLAHHYVSALELLRSAGRVEEAFAAEAPALRFLLLAGDRAMGLSVPVAAGHYRRALELATADGEVVDQEQRARVLAGLAEAEQILGDVEGAAQHFQSAAESFEAAGDDSAVLEMRLRFALAVGVRGEGDRFWGLLDGLIADLERGPHSAQLARAYAERAYPGIGVSFDQAIEWADRALTLSRELDLPEVRVRALVFRGGSRSALGDPGGLDDLRAALRLALDLGLTRQTYVCYFNLVGTLCYQDPTGALETADEGLRFVASRGLAEGEAWIRAFRLQAMFQAGRWAELLTDADGLIEWAGARRYGPVAATASFPKVWVLTLTGRVEEAAAFAEATHEEVERVGMVALDSLPVLYRGNGTERAGSERAGSERAEQALVQLIGAIEAERGGLIELACEAARSAVALGRRDLLDRCGALVDWGLAFGTHARESWTGLVAEVEGRAEDAVRAFERAEAGWGAFGNPFELAEAAFGRARSLAGLGRGGEAAAACRSAMDVFRSLGARPALLQVTRLLEAVGGVAPEAEATRSGD
jgi:class 3 adenylate cyclase/tetratricopeptide (TPR) repeat protein